MLEGILFLRKKSVFISIHLQVIIIIVSFQIFSKKSDQLFSSFSKFKLQD